MRSRDHELMVRIREYVEEYALAHNGRAPSTTMIGKHFNMSRVSGYRYLRSMNELGMITYRDGQVVTDQIGGAASFREPLSAHYSEGITAGAPAEVEGAVDEYFAMPPLFVDGQKGRFFTLSVRGDSMVDAGIEEGDIVICRETKDVKPDDIVAAYIRGSGSTLKRFCIDDDGPFLWAENRSWSVDERMFGREFDIQGLAFKVLKNI